VKRQKKNTFFFFTFRSSLLPFSTSIQFQKCRPKCELRWQATHRWWWWCWGGCWIFTTRPKMEIRNSQPFFFFFGCYPLIVFSINREQNSEIKRHLAFFL
jgi:hypothetical protein